MTTRYHSRAFAGIRAGIALLSEISPALGDDLRRDMDDLAGDLQRAAQGDPPLEDFNDHLKSAIRSLFGSMEAFTYSLTAAVLKTDSAASAMPKCDYAILTEKDHDSVTDTISTETHHYPLAVRLDTAARHFLPICGVPMVSDWDPEARQHLKALTHVRNRFTHPTRIEHLIVTPAFESFRQVSVWYLGYGVQVLTQASDALGLPRPPAPPITRLPQLPVSFPKVEDVFDEAFYRRILSDPGAAIRYISFFSDRLDDELKRAFDHARQGMAPPYDPGRVGRSVRRMVRAITTNLEGLIGFTSFFMRAVRRSKAKVTCPPSVKAEKPPDRALRVLAAFSAAFGSDAQPTRDKRWHALSTTFDIRDRLTHPKAAKHVHLGLTELDTAMDALRWLLDQAFPAVLLDQDKIADCFGSRKPAA